jgi:hypothetical protein
MFRSSVRISELLLSLYTWICELYEPELLQYFMKTFTNYATFAKLAGFLKLNHYCFKGFKKQLVQSEKSFR